MNSRLALIALGLAGLVVIIYILRQSADSLPSMGGDRIASVVYMGILAVLIGSAILSSRNRLSHTVKQLVAWAGIFLFLMATYIYRYELQDIASRMSAGLIPGSPISAIDTQGRTQITLIRDNSGHFSAKGAIGSIVVKFLVDTGATDIVLANRDAVNAGIDTKALHYNIPVTTANGMTTSARNTIKNLSIGPIEFQNLTVMIARPGDLQTSLLGMNYINRLHSFEIRGDRMILTR